MIVNYKNYPVLKFMKNLKGAMLPLEWKIIQDDIISAHDSLKFHECKVTKLSDSFHQSITGAFSKMVGDNIWSQSINETATILDFKMLGINDKFSIQYRVGECENGFYNDLEYYLFFKDSLVVFRSNGKIAASSDITYLFNNFFNHYNLKHNNKNDFLSEIGKYITTTLIGYLNFIKYAEIETKILLPKSKEGKTIKCKYINQTDHKITYLNSTWFTNLVKSDAFKVSGHFRLQPCHDENGLPTKKLIWISDFVKNGYTAPARKLKNNL